MSEKETDKERKTREKETDQMRGRLRHVFRERERDKKSESK